jgi:hypothetical protein
MRKLGPLHLVRVSAFALVPLTSWLAAAPALALDPDERTEAPSLPSDEGASSDPHVARLEEEMADLKERLRQSEEERQSVGSKLTINGYADLGFFVPIGGGVGWVRDTGNMQFPGQSKFAWTFLGDILAPAVNSRGEPASVGNEPGLPRFDSVNSNGAPGFIANEVNLRLGYALTERALLRTGVNFVPRAGMNFYSGDFVEVDTAELEYVATDDGKTSFFVGKTLPVFGIEYKERRADQRFGVTPSLLARYTSGSQLGLKFRSKLLNDWLVVAGAITNNSSGTEMFVFSSEIAQHSGKTLNGRVALSIPLGEMLPGLGGDTRVEVGASGEWGPQDWARDNGGKIWFAGVDLQVLAANFAVKGQFMRGGAPGRAEDGAWGLELHNAGYLELNWLPLSWLGLLGRADLRDALVWLGLDRIYITKEYRLTGGVRVVFNPHIAFKAEFLHTQEYGMAQIKNDIATSSLVLSF